MSAACRVKGRMTQPNYRAFVAAIMAGWPEPASEGMDGLDYQQLAEKTGVLVGEQRTTYCNAGDPDLDCRCAEGYDEGGKPWTCYRLAPDVLEAQNGT